MPRVLPQCQLDLTVKRASQANDEKFDLPVQANRSAAGDMVEEDTRGEKS